ncbi:MAG TPA: hypothetical protein VGZ22_25375 [Isosphaeraceae bacterium]|jgi:hypothetical protein|nr:hypothetical protein [Isosphaeraceae bacterium]
MRGLRKLVPEDAKNSLNASPVFQWFVMALVFVVGIFLVLRGVHAIRNKTLTGKRGQVFEGFTAQFLGLIYAVLGAAMVVVPIVSLFLR